MARREKPDEPGNTEINNPFANLQIDNLPLGEEPAQPPKPAKQLRGRVVLRRETAHRGGKTVIVIHDFASYISTQSIEDLGRKLRQMCGCGGTTRQRIIEVQGDHVTKIRSILEEEGYRVAGVR